VWKRIAPGAFENIVVFGPMLRTAAMRADCFQTGAL
jgi:hypothetical protein